MRHDRRWRSRLARALIAVAAAAATGAMATPANAAEPGYLDIAVPDVTIGGEGAPGKAVPIFVQNSGATGAKATFSFAELAGVAEAEVHSDFCEAAGEQVTCEFPDAGTDEQYEIYLPLVLRPADGVKAGATGTVRWRTEADNDIDRDGFTPVSVVDGVDLVVTTGGETIKDVKPGEAASVPIAFANAGNVTTPRVRLFVFASPGIRLGEDDDCEYVAGDDPLDYSAAQCDIDMPLAPDQGLEGDFKVVPDDTALAGEVIYTVEPLDEETAALPLAKGEKLRAGSGRALTLQAKPATKTLAAVEIDDSDNLGYASVEVDNSADLSASGATLHGAAGETVSAKIGLTNLGPATVQNQTGEGAVSFVFTVPPGTSVVDVPEPCVTASDSSKTPGADAYLCLSDAVFAKGDKVTPTFKLKITEVVEGAEGTVQAVYRDGNPNLRYDKNLANNTATVVVNPAADGETGGTSGELPVTGVKVGAIAGGGIALLALGGTLFLIGRRRRVVVVDDNGND
jgi:hypothetical protein